jgi:hypothetical protein
LISPSVLADARHLRAPTVWYWARTHSNFVAVVALAAFALICLYPILDARFVLVDDGEILSYTTHAEPSTSITEVIARDTAGQGRFRPAYWAFRLAEVHLFGDNSFAWHALVLGLGIAAAAVQFWVARQIGIQLLAALLSAALLVVGPGVSSIWVRLGPNETIATVWLVFSLLAAVVASRQGLAWDALFLVCGVLAMLSKESFALTGVGLAGFRLLLGVQPGRVATRHISAAGLMLVGGFGIAFIDYRIGASAGTTSYGGRYLAGANPLGYLLVLGHNGLIVVYASCAWLVALAAAARPRVRDRIWSIGALLAAAVVVPQVGLYSLQGVMEGRYEVPSTIALSLLTALTVSKIRAAEDPRFYRLAISTLAGAVVLFGFSTWSYAAAFAADSQQLDSMLTAVAERSPPGGGVALVADPGRQYEPVLSMIHHLAYHGRGDLAVRLVSINPDVPYNSDESAFAADVHDIVPNLESADCGELRAVIVLADIAADQPSPCPLASLRLLEFQTQVLEWGGETVSFRPRLPGLVTQGYRAYVP